MRSPTIAALVLAVALCPTAALGAASAGGQKAPAQKPGQAPIKQVTPPPPEPPPTAVLSGHITSLSDHKPVLRARVVVTADELFRCPPNFPPDKTADCPRYNRVALTDANGAWTVDSLPRGKTYVVTVSKTGFAPRAFGETPPAVPPSYVELKAGEKKENIDVEIAAQLYITGTLFDEDESPFAGALVEALRAVYDNGQRRFVTVAESVTDDTGQFRLFGMPPG